VIRFGVEKPVLTGGRALRSAINALKAGANAAKPRRKEDRKGDRHSPGYMAEYMRERRAAKKAKTQA
jgi:hypothetical protein